MDNKTFLILVIVCIITHLIRTVYEILKHKKILKANTVSFVIMFANMFILWVSWVALCLNDIERIALPGIIRYTGVLLIGTGIVIFLMALFTIKTLESYEGDLITKGIYSKIRHPMYSGFILWLIGFPVYYGAVYAFFLSFIFIANILLWRHLEEKELVERFPAYKDYRKLTLF